MQRLVQVEASASKRTHWKISRVHFRFPHKAADSTQIAPPHPCPILTKGLPLSHHKHTLRPSCGRDWLYATARLRRRCPPASVFLGNAPFSARYRMTKQWHREEGSTCLTSSSHHLHAPPQDRSLYSLVFSYTIACFYHTAVVDWNIPRSTPMMTSRAPLTLGLEH